VVNLISSVWQLHQIYIEIYLVAKWALFVDSFIFCDSESKNDITSMTREFFL